MKKILLVLIFISILHPSVANAKITTDGTFANQTLEKMIIDEAYNIEKQIPVFETVNWIVYGKTDYSNLPDNFIPPSGLLGFAHRGMYISMYNPPDAERWYRYGIAHEIGHLFRYKFVSDELLILYCQLRTKGNFIDGYYNLNDEIFAEDFRETFGSEYANPIPNRSAYGEVPVWAKIWLRSIARGETDENGSFLKWVEFYIPS